MFTDEQLEAAVRALSDPDRFAGAERLVSAAAPQLQRVLTQALNEGGWFGAAHQAELRSAIAEPDEVHLVLSTTASEQCIQLAVSRFGDVRVDKIIFTKLDEAAHVGVVLNVVRKVNKSLSYVTTGQDVPDDIEVGRGRRLAQLILGSGL